MKGLVVTFYSYKGGVGRSFALANSAVILAQWGLRVLTVDWDIEAPGLNHYFEQYISKPSLGVIDFLTDCRDGSPQSYDKYTQIVDIPDCRGALSLMPAAGADGKDYARTVQDLNWDALYTEHGLGRHIETMRSEWINSYDIILIDSRTGITDFSGITTVQLPDYLVFFFTANRQSLHGCCNVVRRAMNARKSLPVDRPALVPIPIPAKFELGEEYDRANAWRSEFASTLKEFFQVWTPKEVETSRLVDNLIIPYVPRWSFGEELAVLTELAASNGTRTATFPVSYALETLASLLANRLDRIELFSVSRDEFVLTAKSAALKKLTDSKTNKTKVFISYTRNSINVAISLANELMKIGLSVWYDGTLDAGEPFEIQIEEPLASADALVLILDGVVNRWQTFEVERFIRFSLRGTSERPILPIVLPGAKTALREFRFLSTTQFIEIDGLAPLEPQLAIAASRLVQILDPGAEPLYRHALKINEASYGENHPAVATGLNNLAGLLETTNRLAEAEPIFRRALEINEASYGENHPDVATSLNNLASLLRTTNRLAEAEPLFRRALEINEASYGENHPDVATSLNNLAGLLRMTNRLSEAEPLYRRALKINEANYGENHPEVATCLNNLAELLRTTNRLSEAEPLYRRALKINEASYGENHPAVATGLNNLAMLLQTTHRLAEAEPLYRRALKIIEGMADGP